MPDGNIVTTAINWMERLDPEIRRRPVRDLVIPGSHDAGTFMIGPIGREAARTQNGPVGAQLAAGSRYLDLRATEAIFSDAFFMSHGPLVSDYPLKAVIEELHRFARDHPREVVFATLSLEGKHANGERERVASALRDVAVPLDRFHAGMSLDEIAGTGRNVILCDWSDGRFMDRSGIYSEKAQTPRQIEEYYFARYDSMPRDRMWIWHPNPPYHFGGPSLERNAAANFAWFRDRFENGIFAKKRPNVINLDFIDEFDWADPVISMNG